MTNYCVENKEPELYGPMCVNDVLDINFKLIEPNSRIDLFDGFVDVLENKCWKAEECVANLLTLENKKILHTADSSEFSEELKSINREIDLCFVACFESNFNDYLDFLNTISTKMVIPYHFNEEKIEEAEKLNYFLKDNKINSKFLSIGEEIKI